MLSRFLPLVALSIAALVGLASCGASEDIEGPPDWPPLQGGSLLAGASGTYLDLPVGIPLGGYTGRDRALGWEPGPDARDSDYRTDFVASAGWQTRIAADVLWLQTDDADAVLVRLDLIYSFDELTEAIGAELSARTGRDLTDSVFTFTNHSHSSYGTFSKAMMLFFGADFFRDEVFDRIVEQAVEAAMAAFEQLEPAAIGLGIDEDFDPSHSVFRDRRSENNDLPDPEGNATGPGYKDDRVSMLRVDSVAGEPIAALFSLGMHGTVMDADNHLISTDGPGHLTELLKKRHGGPVWMFAQGAGGDVSPAGRHSDFARMEWLAEEASARLLALYDSIELSDAPVLLDPVQRYVRQGRDIRVTRDGTVDLYYLDYDEAWDNGGYYPDYVVWEDDGSISSPLDEFWAHYGAALCGEGDLDIPMFGLDVDLPMYSSCLDFERGFPLFRVAFQPYIDTRDDFPLPLPESRTSLLGALGLSGIPVTRPGVGTEVIDTVFAFAPGETTTLWTQFLRHRAGQEQGASEVVVFGYAMDHEGYLLTVDDWLMAGYEPTITWWGPLQGEYLMERLLDVIGLASTPVAEDPAYPDYPTSTWYPNWETPLVTPDPTPEAGTDLDMLPEYIFTRDGVMPEAAAPSPSVPRLQGIARWSFFGSDPAMGLPSLRVQRQDASGSWVDLTTTSGLAVTDVLSDIIVTYTPTPLRGTGEDPDPVRTHLYHAEWQATETSSGLDSAAGLPLGAYRLMATGLRRDEQDDSYPFDGVPWELASPSFDVVSATIDAAIEVSGSELTATLSYPPGSRAYRNVHYLRAPDESLPLADGDINLSQGVLSERSESEGSTELRIDITDLPTGPQVITVTDSHGNQVNLEFDHTP